MDKHQKRLMRKIRQQKRRRYGGSKQDDELLHESDVPQQDNPASEMMRLQGLIGNQAVQRLMNNGEDKQGTKNNSAPDDGGSSIEKANDLIGAFKASQHYQDLIGSFSNEQIAEALDALKGDAAQFLKTAKSQDLALPLLKQSVMQYIENQNQAKTAEQQSTNPYPFLPTIHNAVNQVLVPDRLPQAKDNTLKLDEIQGEITEEKTLEEREGGDFTDGKDPGKHIEDSTIQTIAKTKVSLEGLLVGMYKQMPEETMKEFQEVHDALRTSSGYIAHKTRETTQEAFDSIKVVVDATKASGKEPMIDPIEKSPKDSENMKDSVLKAAITARTALTNLLANKPDVAEEALEEETTKQQKLMQSAAADDDKSIVMPDIGAIKAQGFVMSHNKMLDEYITSAGTLYGSDPRFGKYAEELVALDMLQAPQGDTVVILSAYEPIMRRQAAITNLALMRPDLKVFVCYVNGITMGAGNRLINATHGTWLDVINFR